MDMPMSVRRPAPAQVRSGRSGFTDVEWSRTNTAVTIDCAGWNSPASAGRGGQGRGVGEDG